MSLVELLADDMFEDDDARLQGTNTTIKDTDEYNECLQLYLKGQFKQCLERIVDLLCSLEIDLRVTSNWQRLFIDSCDGVDKFDQLGISVQKKLEIVYGYDQWEKFITDYDLSKYDLSTIIKYLKNCVKYVELKNQTKDKIIVETFRQLVESVIDIVSQKINDDVPIDEIYGLILFFIQGVHMKLLQRHKKDGIQLYQEICKQWPQIHGQFQKTSVLGPTYESLIQNNFNPKPKKKKQNLPPPKEVEEIELQTPSEPVETSIEHCFNEYRQLLVHYYQILYRSPHRNAIMTSAFFTILFLIHQWRKWRRKNGKSPLSSAIKVITKLMKSLDQY